jgi:hypothetical protein
MDRSSIYMLSVVQTMPLELIAGAVVGAAVASPSARKVIRRGLIYGLGGALIAYDKVAEVAQKAVKGARKGVQAASDAETANESTPVSPPENGMPSPAAEGQSSEMASV